MHFTRRSLFLLLLIGILLTSCGGNVPTPDVNGTVAAAAGTMAAALFQTQTALAPAATNTAIPSATFLPTPTAQTLVLSTPTVFVPAPVFLTPTPTGTFYTSTPLASSLGVGCLNLRLVEAFTEPKGPFLPGQDFTQSWQVENNGTCDWMYVFSWEFVSGDKLANTTSVRLSNKIEPYKWTTLSVNLHAPNNPGTYKSSWRLTDGGGTQFGAILPVSITVVAPTKTPNATQTANAVNTAAAAAATANAAATNAAATLTQAAVNATATCQAYLDAGNPAPCP
ncbi:MAG: NBR1-Ig-like domain-containing protein [Anaerolineales bacterium]